MKVDFAYSCGWNRFLLNLSGFWPKRRSSFVGTHWPLINAILVLVVIIIPRFAAMCLFWNEVDAFIQFFTTQLVFINVFFKLIVLQLGNEVLVDLLSMMEANLSADLTKEQYAPVLKLAKFGRTISIIVGLSAVGVVITGVVAMKLYHLDSLYIKNPDPRLSVDFFFVAYLPFDATHIISYTTVFALQLYVSVISTIINLNLDSFVMMLILHICGEMEVVEVLLSHLGDGIEDRRGVQLELKRIVRKHQMVCQYVKNLEKLFSIPWFLELTSCTLIFCFQGYNVLKLVRTDQFGVFQIGFIIFSTSGILTQFFLNCWAGECLLSRSSRIGYSFYRSKWYELRPSETRPLLMIGFQKTRPLTLTAWKFSILSIRLFLQLIKTSFSYLSVLLVMTDFQDE
ncbi:odorant receptor 4 [Diachasma alloeum]|uniref:Odorant receptor n=1 Tax=Diachasma alloeum TaxID=454923 RepID=A0A4E0RM75_9HYME|nr:odorant receptor 4 [Diachasma alloeum]THK33249.1 odorant receptor 21 [Diachasma alloeum]